MKKKASRKSKSSARVVARKAVHKDKHGPFFCMQTARFVIGALVVAIILVILTYLNQQMSIAFH